MTATIGTVKRRPQAKQRTPERTGQEHSIINTKTGETVATCPSKYAAKQQLKRVKREWVNEQPGSRNYSQTKINALYDNAPFEVVKS